MSQMFSRIRNGGLYYPPWWTSGKVIKLAPEETELCALKKLRTAKVIEASGIAEAFYAGTPQERWDFRKDFSCLAPLVSVFWIEMGRPSKVVSELHGELSSEGLPSRVGFLCETFEAKEGIKIVDHVRSARPLETRKDELDRIAKRYGRSIREKQRRYGPQIAWSHMTEEEKQAVFMARDCRENMELGGLRANFPVKAWTYCVNYFAELKPGRVFGPMVYWVFVVGEDGRGLFRRRCFPQFADRRRCPSYDAVNSLDALLDLLLFAINAVHRRNLEKTGEYGA